MMVGRSSCFVLRLNSPKRLDGVDGMNYNMCLLPSAHAAHTRDQGPLLQNFKHDFPLLMSAWHHHPSSQP
eukprot:scaffold25894_cov137-Amphora_coffeaeformis.AAC.1